MTEITMIDMLSRDEGRESKMYKCPAGYMTIGIGFNLEAIEMPQRVMDLWCQLIVDDLRRQLLNHSEIGPIYQRLSPVRQMAIKNMAYQLGINGLSKFKNMWAAAKSGDWYAMAAHAKDSKWYRQSGERGPRICSVLETGTMEAYQ